MERRSVLKSAILALGSRSFAFAAKPSSRIAPPAIVPPSTVPRSCMIAAHDGAHIHYRDWGVGRPIVFVAPWGLCSDWWDTPVMNFSERGWRCASFDRRGHARSDDPWRGYDGLVDVGYDKHLRIHKSEHFACKGVHINGIEAFWSFTERRLAKFNGFKTNFHLHLKESEWRWNKSTDTLIAELIEMMV